jgi:hypothetical protein
MRVVHREDTPHSLAGGCHAALPAAVVGLDTCGRRGQSVRY